MLDLMPRAAAALASPARRDAGGLLKAVLADRDTVAARAVARLGLDARALAADVLDRPFGACLEDWVLGPLGLAESVSLQQLPAGGLHGELRGGLRADRLRAGEPPLGGQVLGGQVLGGQVLGGSPGGIPVARGHAFDAGLLFPVRPSAVLALGAGDLVASARDVAALAAATVNGRLLPPESAREILVPYAQCGPDTWQGLGVQVEHHGPVRLIGHGGTFPGFEAAACACPETRQSAALLANTNTGLLKDQLRKALGPRQPVRFPQT